MDKISPNALISSVTPHFKIAEIEKYFPNHPVLRLGLNLSIISGAGVGTFYCGSVDNEDTKFVARFLIKTFGELIEVGSEDEFEKVWDMIFALSCGNYLLVNNVIDSMINSGVNPALAKNLTTIF